MYKVYVFIKFKSDPDKPRRFQKLASRVYIGYFIGYKFTSIYKVWIFYKKKMVLVQDMIFNEEVFFDGKPTKITMELMMALDEVVDLVEV